jgi:hypothetical protein
VIDRMRIEWHWVVMQFKLHHYLALR